MKSVWLERCIVRGPKFALCLNETDFKRHLKDIRLPVSEWPSFIKNDHSNATAHIFSSEDEPTCVIVCMRGYEERDPVVVAGLLVHEAVHIWQEFCFAIGEKTPSQEFEAYSIQMISQRLMWEFVRQTKGHA